MQHVNDDMDDLFKRAAENYPLKTDSADWKAVVKKLSERDDDKPAAVGKNKHLLWLLLLIPLAGLYFYISGNNGKAVNQLNKTIVIDSKNATPANNSTKVDANKNPQQPSLSESITSRSNSSTVKPVPINLKNPLGSVNFNRIQQKTKGRMNFIITGSSSLVSTGKPSKVNDQKTGLTSNKKADVVSETGNSGIANSKVENTINNENDPAFREVKEDSENKNTEEKKTTALQKKGRKQKERGLYGGIFIAPDISTVKLQSIKKVGVSMGIIVGYQLNKKISVESGVSWDVKNYYSGGEYFNKSIVYPNPNIKIKSVEGVCNMIEVPVMIKYNLTTNKNTISISGGLSSYFMKKEDYDYIIIYNNGQPYPRSASYKNSSTDLLAVANFAIGYNHQLKKGVALRIEPYLKVPVKGVGIGSLPIMSTGVNIGITKKISR